METKDYIDKYGIEAYLKYIRKEFKLEEETFEPNQRFGENSKNEKDG